ncbi:hypothetical protein SAMN02745687_02345 [Lachnospiraceae bacterium NK3A20]|nr:hypothetical protein SAMN02745687_02345 [Lachnospiraceae bacterium NK3A20]
MIGVEFLKGMGLGNRLFCYITARSIAEDRGAVFATAGREYLGADFMELDLGEEIHDVSAYRHYHEKEKRLYLTTSPHDMVHGCFVGGTDEELSRVPDNTILYGNLQAEDYFRPHRNEIGEWLRVKKEFESYEYTSDDLCILNVRGGEYAGDPALFLRRKYWTDAMKVMRSENPRMRFMIVTDDTEAAAKLLPGIEAHHFSPEKDYVTVKNARYLVISNSSFAFFPAYTSTTVHRVIAPKYWARHNVSNGYWASEQNIYDEFEYLGRDGKLYSPEECRRELAAFHYPETQPYAEEDPKVAAVRKRNERQRLVTLAVHKAQRILLRQGK